MAKKNWMIQEPQQTKLGGWISHVADPDTKEIVYEFMDSTKKWCLDGCIKWAIDKNKGEDDAKSETMGSTVDVSGGNNIPPIEGSSN